MCVTIGIQHSDQAVPPCDTSSCRREHVIRSGYQYAPDIESGQLKVAVERMSQEKIDLENIAGQDFKILYADAVCAQIVLQHPYGVQVNGRSSGGYDIDMISVSGDADLPEAPYNAVYGVVISG